MKLCGGISENMLENIVETTVLVYAYMRVMTQEKPSLKFNVDDPDDP